MSSERARIGYAVPAAILLELIHPAFGDPIIAAGYPQGVTVGESLAWGEESAATPAEIVEGRRARPSHRTNVRRPERPENGIDLAYEASRPVNGPAALYASNLGRRPAPRADG